MPVGERGGSNPGERRGSRPKGGKNKSTLERKREIARALGELDRPLGKDAIAEAMMKFRKLAEYYAPLSFSSVPNENADERLFAHYVTLMGEMGHKLAPFESPRFASISYEGPDLDTSVYTDDELTTLQKLLDKGHHIQQSDTGGDGSTHN